MYLNEDLIRAESDLNGTIAQRTNLLLIGPDQRYCR